MHRLKQIEIEGIEKIQEKARSCSEIHDLFFPFYSVGNEPEVITGTFMLQRYFFLLR